jgi:hypothetical protein
LENENLVRSSALTNTHAKDWAERQVEILDPVLFDISAFVVTKIVMPGYEKSLAIEKVYPKVLSFRSPESAVLFIYKASSPVPRFQLKWKPIGLHVKPFPMRSGSKQLLISFERFCAGDMIRKLLFAKKFQEGYILLSEVLTCNHIRGTSTPP